MHPLRVPRTGVAGLTFSPDGDLLAGVGDRAVLCWARGRGWEPSGLPHRGTVTAAAFHPNGRTLAYAALSRFDRVSTAADQFTGVRFHPLAERPEFRPEVLPFVPGYDDQRPAAIRLGEWLRGLAFTADGERLVAADVRLPHFRGPRVDVRVWRFGAAWQRVANAVLSSVAAESGIALLDDTTLVLAGVWGVHVLPAGDDPNRLRVRPVARCRAVAVAPGCGLVAAVEDAQVVVWHLRDANRAAVVPDGSVTAVALAPDGSALATGHADGAVGLWDVGAAERRAAFDFGLGAVGSLAFAPDGLTLAASGRKGAVVFDVG